MLLWYLQMYFTAYLHEILAIWAVMGREDEITFLCRLFEGIVSLFCFLGFFSLFLSSSLPLPTMKCHACSKIFLLFACGFLL